MKKPLLLLITTATAMIGFAQTDSFDVFIFRAPEFFTKIELPGGVQFDMSNKDAGFCTITLYKSLPARETLDRDVHSQWKEQVVKKLTSAHEKPSRVLTGQTWDGWVSALAVGNAYRGKIKCVVMLNTFRNDKMSACVVFSFSDKSFKAMIEKFSNELHLVNNIKNYH